MAIRYGAGRAGRRSRRTGGGQWPARRPGRLLGVPAFGVRVPPLDGGRPAGAPSRQGGDVSDRVLATQAALEAAVRLHASVRDIQAAVEQVIALGDALADPAVWDSPEAARFRQTEWPQRRAGLPSTLPLLERTRANAERTIRAILEAGASGRLDSPAPPAGHPSVAPVGHPPATTPG